MDQSGSRTFVGNSNYYLVRSVVYLAMLMLAKSQQNIFIYAASVFQEMLEITMVRRQISSRCAGYAMSTCSLIGTATPSQMFT